jgi:DNA-binding NarL/FixJ family response regulator
MTQGTAAPDSAVIRIMIVDDHSVVRAGIRALIETQDDLTVVGEAADSEAAADVARRTRPDVVLMDLNLGTGPGGVAATADLSKLPAAPRVLILTTYDTEADILAAIDAGAAGYLLKDAPPDDVFRAIRDTARGDTVLAPTVAATLVRRATSPTAVLTEREVAILELLADGLGNKSMAKQLLVSEATVKSHLSHIYTKLDVDTRAGAVAKAIEQRIIRT